MKIKKRIPVIFVTAAMMIMTAAVPASAASPKNESVKYEGKGKVEVEFRSKVKYRNASVTVKDTSGKKYSAYIVDRDSNDLDFRIRNYKAGKTYKFTIKGVKKRGTSKYGSVTGTVKIPAPAASSEVTSTKAYEAAVLDAVSVYGMDAASVTLLKSHLDRDDGVRLYEIEFTGYVGSTLMEFEYEVSVSTGKILDRDCEVYDPYDD